MKTEEMKEQKYVATFLKQWNCQQSSEAGSKADVGMNV